MNFLQLFLVKKIEKNGIKNINCLGCIFILDYKKHKKNKNFKIIQKKI